jgi:hypothetical membrane protein
MTITSARELDHPAAETSVRPLRVAGWAGVLGPVLFTVVFLAQDLTRGGYDPAALPISALAAVPGGWVQNLNFLVFGVLTLAFAAGLHRGIGPTRFGALGPALLAVTGVGLLLAAAFPLRADAAGVIYDPGPHWVGGLLFFPATALALIALSFRLARDPRWRDLAPYVGVVGAVAVAFVVVFVTLAAPDDGILHDRAGVLQRALLLTLFFPCRVVLASRLLRITRP